MKTVVELYREYDNDLSAHVYRWQVVEDSNRALVVRDWDDADYPTSDAALEAIRKAGYAADNCAYYDLGL